MSAIRPASRQLLAVVTVVVLAAGLGGIAPSFAIAQPTYPVTATDAQTAIEEELAASGATSIVASLADLNGTAWVGGTGAVDAGGALPSATTRYGIGSISKMIATVAIMQLVDQSKIGLDQPVVTYLPAFTMRSPQYRQITLRMLLNHTAGLPGTTYGDSATTTPYPQYPQAVLANLARSSLKTTPGAMSSYCNDCFTVAGEVVAAVSGQPYPAYVARNIFAPLGMTQSGFIIDAIPARGSIARVVAGGKELPLEIVNAPAAGGMWSTATDMAIFARMILGNGSVNGHTILSPGAVAEMGRLQIKTTLDPVENAPIAFGLGWDTVHEVNFAAIGQLAWAKDGDSADYHANLVVLPDAGIAAFVAGAGNTFSSSQAGALAQRIAMHALAERGDIASVPEPMSARQPVAARPTEDDLNAMLGHYLSAGAAFQLVRDGDALTLEYLVGADWQPLIGPMTYRADGAWWPIEDAKLLSFRSVTGWGRTYLIESVPRGFGNAMTNLVVAQRVESTGPMATAWVDRLGTWLLVGERPDSTRWLSAPATMLTTIPGLSGYLRVLGASTVDATDPHIGSMFLQIPLGAGADLDDLEAIGGGLLRMGSAVMRTRESVPVLASGGNTVRIGARGYAQWRSLAGAGTATIRGPEAWHLYDADLKLLASGGERARTVKAPADALLIVFGDPGDVIDVNVS